MTDGAPSAAAASLMHQTNADGVQQRIVITSPITAPEISIATKPKLLEILLNCICCYSNNDSDGIKPYGRNSPSKSMDYSTPLLPPLKPEDTNKKCLVLDLDETLVHSSFKPIPNPDYVIPVEIEGVVHKVFVLKRPGVDRFLEVTGKYYEIVLYTASLSKYADPLLDLLDVHKVIRHRLFRESCTCHDGTYVKDLARLGRDINTTIIVDNSPSSYLFQPENAIGISTYIDDPMDRELYYCLPFLEALAPRNDVISFLQTYAAYIAQKAEEMKGQF